jgi:hypothetical protein
LALSGTVPVRIGLIVGVLVPIDETFKVGVAGALVLVAVGSSVAVADGVSRAILVNSACTVEAISVILTLGSTVGVGLAQAVSRIMEISTSTLLIVIFFANIFIPPFN